MSKCVRNFFLKGLNSTLFYKLFSLPGTNTFRDSKDSEESSQRDFEVKSRFAWLLSLVVVTSALGRRGK